ncbi:DUF4932 domain-containing protein [Aquimarina mytili]|uniref:DUF4932 domain-containing protein n=1 Tax=Aquimarina mytili TaxID=874423 RepID=A0A937A0S1_9FLAO|nr:DUF4932 domain-containing protein [Aquimarina mytili]MBL0684736.1 DUF4932 domain-containing protein [Aquimarina mytili]
MRFILNILAIIILLLSCKPKNHNEEKEEVAERQIQVDLNPNIHTSHIIEMFVWPGEYPTRPMCVAAQKHFAPFKDHPAVKLSDSLLQNEIFYFDELTEILLYLEDFPSTEFKYPLENSPYANRTGIINQWIKKLSEFYVNANVESFLKANEVFYQGVRQEVLKNLPPKDFISQIEEYYRENKIRYTIIPAPEMPTGGAYGYRGIGPYVYTPDGMLIYQVISASLPVEKDSISNKYEYFGFDNKEFTLRNSYHEFGHAFVNTILAKKENETLLNKYMSLFTPELQKVMENQNYDNWFDCLAEHLVRLGEIRLAERSGNKKWADELRKYHTEKLNFIFLPEFETKIKEYEGDSSIDSFEEFLPNLLKALDSFNSEKIKKRINEST